MLTQFDAKIVFHKFNKHVAAPVIAREHATLRLPAFGKDRPLAIGEVHLLQPVGDPCGLVLDRAHLKPRKAIEDTGEYHRRQRIAYPMVCGRSTRAGQLADIYREFAARHAGAVGGDVQQERHLIVLRRRPQPVVDGIAIGFVGQWRDRDEGADKAELLRPLELSAAFLDIIDIEHRNAFEAFGIGLAEIGDPVVVDAADLGQEPAIWQPVPEETLARLQARAPYPVLLVFNDHRTRVVAALADILPDTEKIDLRGVLKTLPRLHDRSESADLHAVDHPGIVFAA